MAEDQVADEHSKSVKSETSLSVSLSSYIEAQAILTESWIFPFLQGSGALTSGNNLRVNAALEITPVSLFGGGEVVWTPVAFLQVIAGARAGSGWNWNMDFLGSTYYFRGIGVNESGREHVADHPFEGLIWGWRTAGLFQFDFAALSPGDWHHIVFQTQHKIHYDAYTAARDTEAWFSNNDQGENRNGFGYYGSYILGYQMPIFLDMVAVMAEVDKYLTVLDGGKKWGDDLPRWTFSLLGNFKVNNSLSIALVTQVCLVRTFSDATPEADTPFFRERRITDNDDKFHLWFYRVAAIANYKLR